MPRIARVSNYDNLHYPEALVADIPSMPTGVLQQVCDILNQCQPGKLEYYKVVDDNWQPDNMIPS